MFFSRSIHTKEYICSTAIGTNNEPKMFMYSPAQDLDFHIFSSKMMMAARWDRSPVSLKMFMFEEAPSPTKQVLGLVRQFRSSLITIYFLAARAD